MEMNEFKKMMFGVTFGIANDLFHKDNVTLDWLKDHYDDAIRGAIKIALWSEEAGIYKHPSNWFETFKEECFPSWLKKHYPVKYKEIKFDCIYPKWSPAIDKELYNIIIVKGERDD